MLAVDLDGTLLDPRGRVTERTIRAVRSAREAGMEVVICTGRGLVESRHAIDAIEARTLPQGWPVAPVVVAGGAMVADALSGRTLRRWPLCSSIVERVVQRFAEARVATMVLKDPHEAGFDYLIVDTGELDPVNLWWFEKMGVRRRHVASLDLDEHPEHSVRVGFAAATGDMYALGREIMREFEGETTMHHFAAVSGKAMDRKARTSAAEAPREPLPGGSGVDFVQDKPSASACAPEEVEAKDDSIHILEVFDRQVSKWTAIEWLARSRAIDPARVAAIGDEINDLAMIKGAGLGVAMSNAIPAVREAAARIAPSNEEDGVASAIDRILSGDW